MFDQGLLAATLTPISTIKTPDSRPFDTEFTNEWTIFTNLLYMNEKDRTELLESPYIPTPIDSNKEKVRLTH